MKFSGSIVVALSLPSFAFGFAPVRVGLIRVSVTILSCVIIPLLIECIPMLKVLLFLLYGLSYLFSLNCVAVLSQDHALAMSDPNQNPFAAYQRAAAAAAPPAPAPAPASWGAPNGAPAPAVTYAPSPPAPAPAAVDNPGGFGGASLQWGGNENDPNAKTVRLRDRLNEADTERRKDEEAAMQRERASEIRREVRMAKIKYMTEMPDSQPAGTGKSIHRFNHCREC
jgi:hypothetical protein